MEQETVYNDDNPKTSGFKFVRKNYGKQKTERKSPSPFYTPSSPTVSPATKPIPEPSNPQPSPIRKEINDAISNYKLRREAGVPDITINQFFHQMELKHVDFNEKQIAKYSEKSAESLQGVLSAMNRKMNVSDLASLREDNLFVQEALRRKQLSEVDRQLVQHRIQSVQTELEALALRQSVQEESLNQMRLQQEILQKNLTIIDSHAEQYQERQLMQEALVRQIASDRYRYHELKQRLTVLNIEEMSNNLSCYNDIKQKGFMLNRERKKIIKKFMKSNYYAFYANIRKTLKIDKLACQVFVVCDDNFNLSASLSEMWPNIFINWDEIIGNNNVVNDFKKSYKEKGFNQVFKPLYDEWFSESTRRLDPRIAVVPSYHFLFHETVLLASKHVRYYYVDTGHFSEKDFLNIHCFSKLINGQEIGYDFQLIRSIEKDSLVYFKQD